MNSSQAFQAIAFISPPILICHSAKETIKDFSIFRTHAVVNKNIDRGIRTLKQHAENEHDSR